MQRLTPLSLTPLSHPSPPNQPAEIISPARASLFLRRQSSFHKALPLAPPVLPSHWLRHRAFITRPAAMPSSPTALPLPLRLRQLSRCCRPAAVLTRCCRPSAVLTRCCRPSATPASASLFLFPLLFQRSDFKNEMDEVAVGDAMIGRPRGRRRRTSQFSPSSSYSPSHLSSPSLSLRIPLFLSPSRRLAATAPPPSALVPSSPDIGAVAGFKSPAVLQSKHKKISPQKCR